MATTHTAPGAASLSHSNFVALDDLLRRHGRLTLSATLYVGLKVAEEVRGLSGQGRHAGAIPASRVRIHGRQLELAKGRYPSNAPELKAGEAGDMLSDVYEVGSLLYRMLTGHRPKGDFEAPSAVNPAVDTSLDDLVMGAIAADPAARPHSIDALIKGLNGIFAELDLEPSPSELNAFIGEETVVATLPVQPTLAAPPAPAPVVVAAPAPRPAAKKAAPLRRAPPRSWGQLEDDEEVEAPEEVSVIRAIPDSGKSDKIWAFATAAFAVVMLVLVI